MKSCDLAILPAALLKALMFASHAVLLELFMPIIAIADPGVIVRFLKRCAWSHTMSPDMHTMAELRCCDVYGVPAAHSHRRSAG